MNCKHCGPAVRIELTGGTSNEGRIAEYYECMSCGRTGTHTINKTTGETRYVGCLEGDHDGSI